MTVISIDNRTRALHPGKLRISHEKMRKLHPELYSPNVLFPVLRLVSPWHRKRYRQMERHLKNGDTRAAVVVSLQPLIIAAYTDELDGVALLNFPESYIEEYGLEMGSRLLSVNTYTRGRVPVVDLKNGPRAEGRYCNFSPWIADFLSDDRHRIDRHKQRIKESEWNRAELWGRIYLTHNEGRCRDGRPLYASRPAWERAGIKVPF